MNGRRGVGRKSSEAEVLPFEEGTQFEERPRQVQGLSPGKGAKGSGKPTKPSVEPRPGVPRAF